MFTPTETWAGATGAQHKRAIVKAAKASAATLNMISPYAFGILTWTTTGE
jgi:hypothetical protein